MYTSPCSSLALYEPRIPPCLPSSPPLISHAEMYAGKELVQPILGSIRTNVYKHACSGMLGQGNTATDVSWT